MKVTQGSVSDWGAEWATLHLFSLFVFRKRGSGREAIDSTAPVPKPVTSKGPAYNFEAECVRLAAVQGEDL